MYRSVGSNNSLTPKLLSKKSSSFNNWYRNVSFKKIEKSFKKHSNKHANFKDLTKMYNL